MVSLYSIILLWLHCLVLSLVIFLNLASISVYSCIVFAGEAAYNEKISRGTCNYVHTLGCIQTSLVTRPHPQEGERVWYITSEFLVVLSQHVRKTGNPIRLLDLLKSCDMKEN